MAPEGVSVHVERMLLLDTSTFADPPHPDEPTALLAALPMQAIVFAFTTTGYILGSDEEQMLKARLEKRSNGIPVLLQCHAAVAAFRALEVERIALIHPPWFADDQQQRGIKYFRDQGFDVVYANQMRLRVYPSRKPQTRYASLPRSIPPSSTHGPARRYRLKPKPFYLAVMASGRLVSLRRSSKT
jgi:maleate cis-trans isomerase